MNDAKARLQATAPGSTAWPLDSSYPASPRDKYLGVLHHRENSHNRAAVRCMSIFLHPIKITAYCRMSSVTIENHFSNKWDNSVFDDVLLSDMSLFVAVARAKSFTRAANALHMPTSTLSRRVAKLEKKLGLRLLNRTTRTLEITDEGMHYLHHVEHLLQFANQIHDELQDRGRKPTGVLRISLPESVAMQLAVPWFTEFAELYPDLQIEIDTAPDHVDQVADNFDICIYYHPVPDSSLTVRRLASFSRSLCASPRYIAARGMPSHPSELAAHHCICAGANSTTQHKWTLTRGSEKVTVDISGVIATSSLALAPQFAKSGIGIASAMLQAFSEDIAAGRLVPVLPDWEAEPLLLSAIISHRVVPAKTRLFLDFIAQKMKIHEAALQAAGLSFGNKA